MYNKFLRRVLSVVLCFGLIVSQNQFVFAGDTDTPSEEHSSDGDVSDGDNNSSSDDANDQSGSSQNDELSNSESDVTGNNSDNSNPDSSKNNDTQTPGNSNNTNPVAFNNDNENPVVLDDSIPGNISSSDDPSLNNSDDNPDPDNLDQNNNNPDNPDNPDNTDNPDNPDNPNNPNNPNNPANIDNLIDPIQDPDDSLSQVIVPLVLGEDGKEEQLDGVATQNGPKRMMALGFRQLNLQPMQSVGENQNVQTLNLTNLTELPTESQDSSESQEQLGMMLMANLSAVPANNAMTNDSANSMESANSASTSFEVNEKGVLTGYDHTENGSILIPDGVVEISASAFYDAVKQKEDPITSVSFPDSLKIIGVMAFASSQIKDLSIPNNVAIIEGAAFASCQQLEKVSIGNGVKALFSSFANCENLQEVSLPEGLEKIEFNAFGKCKSLKEINLPSSLKYVGGFGESGLTGITIPNRVETIETSSFYHCTSLKKVSIPASVKYIGYNTFDGCSSLTDIYYDGTEEQWNNLMYYQGDERRIDTSIVLGKCNATIHFKSANNDNTDANDEDNKTDDSKHNSIDDNNTVTKDNNTSSSNNSSNSSNNSSYSITAPFDYDIYKKTEGKYQYKSAGYIISSYTDAGSFLNDLSWMDGFLYGVDNYWNVGKASILSIFTGGVSRGNIAYQYMNDREKSRKLLADIINELSNTEGVSYSTMNNIIKNTKGITGLMESSGRYGAYSNAVDYYKSGLYSSNDNKPMKDACNDIANEIYEDNTIMQSVKSVGDLASILESAVAMNEDFRNMLMDYNNNIEMLQSLKKSVPYGSELYIAIVDLEAEYKNSYCKSISDSLSQVLKLYKKSGGDTGMLGDVSEIIAGDDWSISAGKAIAKGLLGKGFSNGDFLWKMAIQLSGSTDNLGEADKVIMSAYMRNDSIESLNTAEAQLIADPSNPEKMETFVNAFRVAKSFTLTQYENMYSYYKRNNNRDKAEALKNKIDELNAFTPTWYIANIGMSPKAN